LHSPCCLYILRPGSNPLVFVVNPLKMKGQDTLGIGHRDTCAGRTLSLIGHLVHALEIAQASLEIDQALVENRLSLQRAKKLEERDTRKKLGVIASVFGGKIAQRGMEQLDPTL